MFDIPRHYKHAVIDRSRHVKIEPHTAAAVATRAAACIAVVVQYEEEQQARMVLHPESNRQIGPNCDAKLPQVSSRTDRSLSSRVRRSVSVISGRPLSFLAC